MVEDYPERERKRLRGLMHRLLVADSLVRVKYLRGELAESKMPKILGNIAIVVDGIVLEALRDKELAEAISPVLYEKMTDGLGNPMIYMHLLEMISFKHQISVGDRTPSPEDVNHSYEEIEKEIDLDRVIDEWKEIEEESSEELKHFREKWQQNIMFG